jgi:hypothetical protein
MGLSYFYDRPGRSATVSRPRSQAKRISLSQTAYIDSIVRKFGLENAKEVSSPMDPNVDLDNPLCDDKPILDRTLYQSMVGSLMYAALGTRPDIAYCVTILSNTSSRKSIGGYFFQTNKASVSWQAKSQSVVALSTLEAEYIACSDATREALWLRRL